MSSTSSTNNNNNNDGRDHSGSGSGSRRNNRRSLAPPLVPVARLHRRHPNALSMAPVHRCQRKRRVQQVQRQIEQQEQVPRPQSRNLHVDDRAQTALLEGELTELRGYVHSSDADSVRFYKAADKNRCRHRWSNLVLLFILGLTSGASTLVNIFNTSNEDGTLPYRITFNVLIVISTALKVWQQVFRFEQKAMNYEMTGDDYFNYAREWRMRIIQGVDDRRDKCERALTTARHTLREIELNALPLSSTRLTVAAAASVRAEELV